MAFVALDNELIRRTYSQAMLGFEIKALVMIFEVLAAVYRCLKYKLTKLRSDFGTSTIWAISALLNSLITRAPTSSETIAAQRFCPWQCHFVSLVAGSVLVRDERINLGMVRLAPIGLFAQYFKLTELQNARFSL